MNRVNKLGICFAVLVVWLNSLLGAIGAKDESRGLLLVVSILLMAISVIFILYEDDKEE